MFYFDPVHIIILVIGMGMMFLANMWLKNTFAKYNEQATRTGQTGAQIARNILDRAGLNDVKLEETPGELSDHYDPGAKTVRLSPNNYHRSSVAAAAVAAHECGHALQHAKGYFPVVIRGAMFPAVKVASQFGPILLMIGIFLGATSELAPAYAWNIALAGVVCYGAAVAFHFVTLPVEFDASARALKVLEGQHYLFDSEMPGARKVLTAAAMTYVVSALYALMELVYWVMRLMGSRR